VTRVILIHGIHTQGQSPVQGLIPYLTRYPVKYLDYGWIAGLETRVVNPIIVGAVLPLIEPDDYIVGHSNGCAIAYDLMNRGARMKGAVFINAALERNIVRPPWVPWIYVIYNAGDEITEAAKIGAALGLTDPVWGEMGHAGYSGRDVNIVNDNAGPEVSGHSDLFTPAHLAVWGPFIGNQLLM
jgi:hypothetical protein